MKESTIIMFRGIYKKILHPDIEPPAPKCEKDKVIIQKLIRDKILSGLPLMVARFGSIELTSLENAKNIRDHVSIWRYISWQGEPNYFRNSQAKALCNNAGFFPMPDEKMMMHFLSLYEEDMKEVDILGSWRYNEKYFSNELKSSLKVDRELMTPLLCEHPWTEALAGKRVLVVHPFATTIESQYKNWDKLFPGTNILPEFTLMTMKAVQSQAGEKTVFKDWFEALEFQKTEIDKYDYDICLLGCGAYGFPLAAHCKRQGKQAIHLGGVLQLLFGIKGRRWETEDTYLKQYRYLDYYNEYWVRPSQEEVPTNAKNVENGCYW